MRVNNFIEDESWMNAGGFYANGDCLRAFWHGIILLEVQNRERWLISSPESDEFISNVIK